MTNWYSISFIFYSLSLNISTYPFFNESKNKHKKNAVTEPWIPSNILLLNKNTWISLHFIFNSLQVGFTPIFCLYFILFYKNTSHYNRYVMYSRSRIKHKVLEHTVGQVIPFFFVIFFKQHFKIQFEDIWYLCWSLFYILYASDQWPFWLQGSLKILFISEIY